MKRLLILFIMVGIYCTSIFSQSERILKTVTYTIDEYNHHDAEGQSLTYTLENGGLRIQGYMLTSCCPSIHSITYLVSGNAIFLSRVDMPFGCDCDNWHFVDFVIEGIPEGDYEVFLNQYQCNLESADYAQVSPDAILLVKEHVANVFELPADLAAKVFAVVPKVATAIKEELGCDGMNILQNNGVEAGQTVFHLHIHFIPRWKDDEVNIKWAPLGYADGEAAALADAIKARIK